MNHPHRKMELHLKGTIRVVEVTARCRFDLIHIDDHGAIKYADNLAPVIARALTGR